jgi:hypothetical protein
LEMLLLRLAAGTGADSRAAGRATDTWKLEARNCF